MRKLGLMLCLAVAPLLGAACSSTSAESDGSTSNDGSTNSDGGSQFFLSRGMNNYLVTTAAVGNDGCMIDPGILKNMTLPVKAVDGTDPATGAAILTLSIGDQKGSPAEASLGTGNVNGTMATLMRDNMVTDSTTATCTWHQTDTSVLTLTANDTFNLAVTEVENTFSAGCGTTTPTGGTCTSTFTLSMTKAP